MPPTRQRTPLRTAETTRVLCLLGGRDFWSNGIHLNVIEAAKIPRHESWRNINAIDDVVLQILSARQFVIAGLRGNAGAGGVMLALAADQVYAREGVVLNPHYRTMGNLYGSEYWTYTLPRRVGRPRAREITTACQPMGTVRGVRDWPARRCLWRRRRRIPASVGGTRPGAGGRPELALPVAPEAAAPTGGPAYAAAGQLPRPGTGAHGRQLLWVRSGLPRGAQSVSSVRSRAPIALVVAVFFPCSLPEDPLRAWKTVAST